MKLKVSFILPCYNVAPYIGRCIDSIEEQNMDRSDFEIICVDDCSTDNTIEVIKQYQHRYANIILHCHKENKSSGGARNTGISIAQGEYLWFVDPDDMLLPNVLQQLWTDAHNRNLDILQFNVATQLEDKSIEYSREANNTKDILTGPDFVLKHGGRKGIYMVTSIYRSLYKRSFVLLRKLEYPEMKAGQDVVFAWRCIIEATLYGSIDVCGYKYIRRDSSVTGNKGKHRAAAVMSQSILFAVEIEKMLNDYRDVDERVLHGLIQERKSALNRYPKDIVAASLCEQRKFYIDMLVHKGQIDLFQPLMNRKIRNIFRYQWPFLLWISVVFIYRVYNMLKK